MPQATCLRPAIISRSAEGSMPLPLTSSLLRCRQVCTAMATARTPSCPSWFHDKSKWVSWMVRWNPGTSSQAPSGPISLHSNVSSRISRVWPRPSERARAPWWPRRHSPKCSVFRFQTRFNASSRDCAPMAPIGFLSRLRKVSSEVSLKAAASVRIPCAFSLFPPKRKVLMPEQPGTVVFSRAVFSPATSVMPHPQSASSLSSLVCFSPSVSTFVQCGPRLLRLRSNTSKKGVVWRTAGMKTMSSGMSPSFARHSVSVAFIARASGQALFFCRAQTRRGGHSPGSAEVLGWCCCAIDKPAKARAPPGDGGADAMARAPLERSRWRSGEPVGLFTGMMAKLLLLAPFKGGGTAAEAAEMIVASSGNSDLPLPPPWENSVRAEPGVLVEEVARDLPLRPLKRPITACPLPCCALPNPAGLAAGSSRGDKTWA
mmetsp:Transcript_117875/g.263490  ORF Transcript_117875/g.263490 Transcript_117875/m.263490 type:complete len:430 (+) Transcript_117875:87-1376(+)